MSILDALEALRAAPAASREREVAGRALLLELRKICAAGCTWNRAVAGRPPTHAQIPTADRDDVAQAVATKILVRNPLDRLLEGTPSLAEKPDALGALAHRYVGAMVCNYWADRLRQRKRQRAVSIDAEPESGRPAIELAAEDGSAHLGAFAEATAEEGWLLVDRVVRTEIAARPERYRAGSELAWRQIVELCFARATMDAILARDEAITPGSTEIEIGKARDRILSAHYRLRLAMLERGELMHRSGELYAAELELVKETVRTVMMRRQSGPGPASGAREP